MPLVPSSTKHVVLGTAGHIDHGKTALVRALTGTDTDRLKEEKERGISIELGFARLTLPSGASVGIVDVPGHERFVRTMLAGAAGIDVVLLVVAADEGVMPQTREHVDIVTLLGSRAGVVALTKADLVGAEELELAREDVEEYLRGTALEGAAIVPVSSVTGSGLDELVARIDALVASVEERRPGRTARLPIDRAFTLAGHGTVVTGTLWSGSIGQGDTLALYPSGRETRVRSVHVHGEPVERAEAGQRTAVGLHGVPKDSVARGDTLGTPGALHVTHMLDARLSLARGARPLGNRTRVHFHLGTSETLARVVVLDRELLVPGEDGLVQMRLEGPVVAEAGDRFVVRSYSPVTTIGGGRVIAATPGRHARMKEDVLGALAVLEEGSAEDVAVQEVHRAGIQGARAADLTGAAGVTTDGVLEGLVADGRLVRVGDRVLTPGRLAELTDRCKEVLGAFATSSPLAWGMSTEELRGKLAKKLDRGLLDAVLAALERDGLVTRRVGMVRWGAAEVTLPPEQARVADAIEARLLDAGAAPPSLDELRNDIASRDFDTIVRLLAETGRLVKVTSAMVFHPRALDELRAKVAAHFRAHEKLGVAEFKDLAGVSRKHAIPILEFLDREGTTTRAGDHRTKGRRAP
ncbi:MAG: selenocysteine-specific translation elongation factor [Candidatus Eisenbacteria bacterium]|nr:selenocysteine-specific translation elongation factor [Candidatus Eisenbacteria bacterium]